MEDSLVTSFTEKPQLNQGWINGGYFVIEPKFFGKTFNLHPVTIIIALLFWGMIWGITGMLLAAPLTAIIRILFEQSDTTKPIALLLSGKLHLIN